MARISIVLSKGANTIWQMMLFCSHHLKEPNTQREKNKSTHTHTHFYVNDNNLKKIFLHNAEIEIVIHKMKLSFPSTPNAVQNIVTTWDKSQYGMLNLNLNCFSLPFYCADQLAVN